MLTPIKAIRAKCLDCCGGSAKEVRGCSAPHCPLFPYRLGHRPKSNLSAETPGKTTQESANTAQGYTDTPPEQNGANSQSIPAFSEKEATPCLHTS